MNYFLIFGGIAALVFGLSIDSKPTKKIIVSVFAGLFFGWIFWMWMPTLAWGFYGLPLAVTIFGIIALLLSSKYNDDGKVNMVAGVATAIGLIWLLIVPLVTSWSAFHSSSYHKLIGEVKESVFNESVSPIDVKQVRTVDEAYAEVLAARHLGEIPEIISRVNMGDLEIQMLNADVTIVDHNGKETNLKANGDLWWVGPLNHSGFFKWLNNSSTPGFVMVSATDAGKVHLVTHFKVAPNAETASGNPRMGQTKMDSTQKLELKYFESGAYFGDDLKRHLRTNGYANQGLTDYSFELRDGDLRPFWVVSLFKKKIGFSGSDAVGVVTVDAQTGEIEPYSIANAPAWIDRIQPHEFVENQIDNWGEYGMGWWNSWLAQNNVQHATPGTALVRGSNGKSYWYTGMQSANGKSNGTVGFMLVDTRTKAAHRYLMSGITEEDAKKAMENAKGIKEASYVSTDPILYNVGGVPTFFAAMHGEDQRPKMFAFIDRETGKYVGVGSNPGLALKNYQIQLRQANTATFDDLVKNKAIESIVIAVTRETVGEYVFTYLLLEGQDGKEFSGNSEISPELKWTKPGDKVKVMIQEGETSHSLTIIKFDNLGLSLKNL